KVVGPTAASQCMVYATKPRILELFPHSRTKLPRLALVGRYGLPQAEDIPWIARLVGRRRLWFVGDADPVDLLVFAYLRLFFHRQVAYLGVGGDIIAGLSEKKISIIAFSMAPSEVAARDLLGAVCPDLEEILGSRMKSLWDAKLKIET